MEKEKTNSRVMQLLDLDIVNNYNRGLNQVLLQINPGLFNKIAEELHS